MYCPNPECPNLLEQGVPAEFRDGFSECSECGHRLEHGEAPARVEAESELAGWTPVAVYDTAEAAHAARGLLETEDIPALVSGEHFAEIGQLPAPLTGGVELSVPEMDAERAVALIHRTSEMDAEPIEDEVEPFDPYREPAETRDGGRPWQVLIVLMLLAGAFLMFQGRSAVETAEPLYDRAAASTFVVLNLPRAIDELGSSEIDLILELDLEYLESAGVDGVPEILELGLDDAVHFISGKVRERRARIRGSEIRGVLELRNRYLLERPRV